MIRMRWAMLLGPGLVLATPSAAQDVSGTSGAWQFGSDATMAAASVDNAQQESFGIVCSGNCLLYVVSDRRCRRGRHYAGVMQAGETSYPVDMTCHHLEHRFVLTLPPDEHFIRITSERSEIGFLVRLDGPEAVSFRFSLDGAYQAISLTLAAGLLNSDPPSEAPGAAEPHRPGGSEGRAPRARSL